jgi:arylsulfatase
VPDTAQPNIILIMTDQQRADSIAAMGAPWMHTPHMDRLVAEGTAFENCFVTSPVCVGARASLFTGKYPHGCQVFSNFQPWQPTWVSSLADAGYHCMSIGKMHINPYDALGGFHQRLPVENKDRPLFLEERDRAFYDEWDKALRARKLVKPSRYTRYREDPVAFKKALGVFPWQLDEDMHPDHFIGDTACWWIEERKNIDPLFLQIGFPGPHPPYDPSPQALARYKDVTMPAAHASVGGIDSQPAAQRELRENMCRLDFDSIAWRTDITPEEINGLRQHYAANVTMIDAHVGRIMAALDAKGYLDNAIVIFTSDHADALGDYGHIQKWTMYDTVVRVPLIVWSRNLPVRRQRLDDLVQMFDIAPTILESAGLPVPPDFEARSLWPRLSNPQAEPAYDVVYSELARDHIQTGSEFIIMRRCKRWKLVTYLDDDFGELYDLAEDPAETRNLWGETGLLAVREDLKAQTLRWFMKASLHAGRKPGRRPQGPMRT